MWYLAQLGIEFVVGGRLDSGFAHVNFHLVHAITPDEAYEKALALGKNYNQAYVNPENELVSMKFAGLLDITEIYEPLEDLAEIFFEERDHLFDAIDLKAKNELSIFCQRME